MDLDDKILHKLLLIGGLFIGSLLKTGFDRLADRFWSKEAAEFREWKKKNRDV